MLSLATSPPRHLLVIADVGGDGHRHIGDEAMLEANLDGFRGAIQSVKFTIVSREPEWTMARYNTRAVSPFGFSSARSATAERKAMLDRILAGAGTERDHPAIEALARADAFIVSGGGNLSATWPDLLYERVAFAQLAKVFNKPTIFLGQTLGPKIEGDERQLLADCLASARFVGVRELPSAALALKLGVQAERLWYQCDDALFGGGPDAPTSRRSGAEVVALTIDPQIRGFGKGLFDALAMQLREFSEVTGATFLLIPHAFGNEDGEGPSDLIEAEMLAERLGRSHAIVASELDAVTVRRLTGEAAMVISTRYHPLVFGLSAGVPSLGIYGDEYCRIKLQGALAHAGLERLTLTYDDVAGGKLLSSALELWRTRAEVRGDLELRREAWCVEAEMRWNAVLRAIELGSSGK